MSGKGNDCPHSIDKTSAYTEDTNTTPPTFTRTCGVCGAIIPVAGEEILLLSGEALKSGRV